MRLHSQGRLQAYPPKYMTRVEKSLAVANTLAYWIM
jgi:hypothetical protein